MIGTRPAALMRHEWQVCRERPDGIEAGESSWLSREHEESSDDT